jgi:hypothetical protein
MITSLPSELIFITFLLMYFVSNILSYLIMQVAVVGTITGNCRFYDASGKYNY